MVTVRGLTEEAIEALLSDNIVNARVQSGDLILTTRGGVDKNLGSIRGATGSTGSVGPTGPPGPARVITDTGWIAFGSGDFGTGVTPNGTYTPRYRKRDGVVHLRGLLNIGAVINTGGVLLTLPTGYRPIQRMYGSSLVNGVPGGVLLEPDGRFVTHGNLSSGVWLSIDFTPFIAETA